MITRVRFFLSLIVTIFLAFTSSDSGKAVEECKALVHQSSHLLELGSATRNTNNRKAPSQIKILSYNIRWRGGEDLRKLIELLKNDPEIGGAAILGLQEVDRNRKRTDNKNTVKFMAEELGMHYAWTAPPSRAGQEEETGVAILSAYPLTQVRRILLPHEGPNNRRRVALGATVNLGEIKLRFYSVHAETRISADRRIEQFKEVLDDLGDCPKEMPAVILGDLNTWQSDAPKKAISFFNKANFSTPFEDKKSTFFRKIILFNIELNLDWIWLRALKPLDYGIDKSITLSDHFPLWTIVELKTDQHSGGK